jgi:hypothetical protein
VAEGAREFEARKKQRGENDKPRAAVTQAGFVLTNMVAGAGFEPTTFGL